MVPPLRTSMSLRPTVFVLDSSPETVELLCAALEDAGLRTAGVSEAEVRLNQANFEALVRVHQPAAIVFDIPAAAPDEWAFFAHVRRTPPCRDIPLVLTTSETSPLKHLMRFDSCEILEKPYELPAVLAAVGRALLRGSPEEVGGRGRRGPQLQGQGANALLPPQPAPPDAEDLGRGAG